MITQRNLCSHIPIETKKKADLGNLGIREGIVKKWKEMLSFVRTQKFLRDKSDCPLTEKFSSVQMNCKTNVRLKLCGWKLKFFAPQCYLAAFKYYHIYQLQAPKHCSLNHLSTYFVHTE